MNILYTIRNWLVKHHFHYNEFLVDYFNFYVLLGFPRHSTRFAKEYFKNKKINCAEIGVWQGYNAKSILNELNVNKIYLIDPYENYNGYSDSNSNILLSSICDLKTARKKAMRKLNKYKNQIVWINKKSSEAVNEIPDNLDFIYLDGNHEYKYVLEDLENYYKKLRKGGILAGHDITSLNVVLEAVLEFTQRNKLKFVINVADFWIIK